VDFTNNQWNSGNTIPSASLFQLASANGFNITVFADPVVAKPACGYYDGPIVIDPPKTRSTMDEDGMPIIWSVLTGDSIRLDQAVIAGMNHMTTYDSLGNDLTAVEHFDEIFRSDVDPYDSLTRNYLWFAFDQMKTSLENAVASGQITTAQNQSDFEDHVEMYVNALVLMTDEEIDAYNYLSQFYHEIEKAHLFRVIGQPQTGLNILTELESCGVDSAAQAQLNSWKAIFESDVMIEQIGQQALDTMIVVDTTGYLSPALAVNQFSFGSVIHSLNNIEYPNCGLFGHRDHTWKTANTLSVFPNPSVSEVTVRWNHLLMPGEGELIIFQMDGRVVLTQKINTDQESAFSFNVAKWDSGVYQIRYVGPNGSISTAHLIVR
jgi:hypothetical protein